MSILMSPKYGCIGGMAIVQCSRKIKDCKTLIINCQKTTTTTTTLPVSGNQIIRRQFYGYLQEKFHEIRDIFRFWEEKPRFRRAVDLLKSPHVWSLNGFSATRQIDYLPCRKILKRISSEKQQKMVYHSTNEKNNSCMKGTSRYHKHESKISWKNCMHRLRTIYSKPHSMLNRQAAIGLWEIHGKINAKNQFSLTIVNLTCILFYFRRK